MDITTLGLGICKHMFQKGDGIRVEYVDPANVVYSYTEDPYFKDTFYWGEIKTVPIAEVIKIDPTITKKKWRRYLSIVNLGMIIIIQHKCMRIACSPETRALYYILIIKPQILLCIRKNKPLKGHIRR